MSEAVRPWIPAGGVKLSLLDEQLSLLTRNWSQRWFSQARPSFAPLEAGNLDEEKDHTKQCSGAYIRKTDMCAKYLVQENIGFSLDAITLTQREEQILERLAGECIDDLIDDINSMLGLSGAEDIGHRPLESGYLAKLQSEDGKLLATLLIDQSLLVAVCKNSFNPSSSGEPLTSRKEAIANTHVTYEFRIAECTLPLSDITELQTGDVVSFDRCAEEAVDLLADGLPVAERRFLFTPEPDGAKFILKKSVESATNI